MIILSKFFYNYSTRPKYKKTGGKTKMMRAIRIAWFMYKL